MSPKKIWLLAVLLVCAYPLSATTYWVGTCHAGSFSTINLAVNSPNVAAGSIINICPGTYQEQVIISKSLSLHGLTTSQTSGATVLPSPSAQTTKSQIGEFAFMGTFAPVIWVRAGTVEIQNLSVLANIVSPPTVVEFYYASGASGTLNHVAAVVSGAAFGILAENADLSQTSVTIENSYTNGGILAGTLEFPTLNLDIIGNQVFPSSPFSFYAIYLYGVNATVKGNYVSGPRWEDTNTALGPSFTAISASVVTSENLTVNISGNTIQITQSELSSADFDAWGIQVESTGAIIESNKISNAEFGIDVSCEPATVSGNTINFAVVGINNVQAGFTGANSFYNSGKTATCP